MAAKKPEGFITELPQGHVQCAADSACRRPGRMDVDTIDAQERLGVHHLYLALDRGAKWLEPPRRMLGVVPKPVAGAD